MRRRADLVGRAVRRLFRSASADGVALLAVGGLGRGELAPHSDVDLLFVHEPEAQEQATHAANAVLYPLWDAGLEVSHALRTPAECVTEAARRIESLTGMLDATRLAGSAPLAGRTRAMVLSAVREDPCGFVDSLVSSREARRRKFGVLAHQLEPDLKESLGGLRDAWMLGWLRAALFDALTVATWRSWRERQAVFFRELARRAQQPLPRSPRRGHIKPAAVMGVEAGDIPHAFVSDLQFARVALHRVANTRSNRLSAEYQEEIGSAGPSYLHPREVAPQPAADQLMWHLYLEARWNDATVEEALARAAAAVGSHAAGPLVRRDQRRPFGTGAMDAFVAVAEHGGCVLREEMSMWVGAGRRERPRRLRWSPALLDAFFDVLRAPGSARALELMDSAGLLGALIPTWWQVSCRVQRDPYHRYPVDVHLWQSAAAVGRLLRAPDEPFAEAAAKDVDDGGTLLLAALLHDVGKVGLGSHVALGPEIARPILDHTGITGTRREDILFLVAEHLLLADTATRRNLDDENLILHTAARIGDHRRLSMLYLLTLADAEATGPAAATPWRLTLVRELVAKIGRVFARGSVDAGVAQRVDTATARIRSVLRTHPRAAVDRFVDSLPLEYLARVRPQDSREHFRLVSPPPAGGEIRVHVRPARAEGVTLLAVGAQDHRGLLSQVAGALTLAGLSILTAQVFSLGRRELHDPSISGIALDLFEVRGAFEGDISDKRWLRFTDLMGREFRGTLDLDAEVRGMVRRYPTAPPAVPARVSVDQDASEMWTLVEVQAPDRIGLLFDLSRALAAQGADIRLAKVATYGPRVVDVFYVVDPWGQVKFDQPEKVRELERALKEAATPDRQLRH